MEQKPQTPEDKKCPNCGAGVEAYNSNTGECRSCGFTRNLEGGHILEENPNILTRDSV